MTKVNTKIRFRHFHDGNDPHHQTRGTATYATRARLIDLTTGNVLLEDWSYCNPIDTISRKEGRRVAWGRLVGKIDGLKRYFEPQAISEQERPSSLAELGV